MGLWSMSLMYCLSLSFSFIILLLLLPFLNFPPKTEASVTGPPYTYIFMVYNSPARCLLTLYRTLREVGTLFSGALVGL